MTETCHSGAEGNEAKNLVNMQDYIKNYKNVYRRFKNNRLNSQGT